MDKDFSRKIGRILEVYVDDIIIKSNEETNFIQDVEEVFGQIRKYELRLNPDKCVFRVIAGKFLGFMVSERGIDVNPTKIKALLNSKTPSSIKDVQRLLGRIIALSRFISRYGDKCHPLFNLLIKEGAEPGRIGVKKGEKKSKEENAEESAESVLPKPATCSGPMTRPVITE